MEIRRMTDFLCHCGFQGFQSDDSANCNLSLLIEQFVSWSTHIESLSDPRVLDCFFLFFIIYPFNNSFIRIFKIIFG